MNRLAIVYWSGTGNTEAMAEGIAEGAREAGAEVELMGPGEFSAARFSEFGAVAFGCPAMGSEVLEESEFDHVHGPGRGPEREEDRAVRLLRLGRRAVDAGLVCPL